MDAFYTAYPLIEQLYGIEMKDIDFETVGLIAWNKIGNKFTKLYRARETICDQPSCKPCCGTKKLSDYSVQLPCNCDILEAVTYGWEDWNMTSNITDDGDANSHYTEHYIEAKKITEAPLYVSGRYVKYELVGDTLYFDNNYGPISILYKGVIMDEDGLPCITEKEAFAIATYCAMTEIKKNGIKTRNSDMIQLSQVLYQDWLRACSSARVPDYINQNEMNEILDANSSWDRKIFNKSYKPIK